VINLDADKLTRRSIVAGAAASLICSRAIVRPASPMPIRQVMLAIAVSIEKPCLGFVGMLRLHFVKQALKRGWTDREYKTFDETSEAAAGTYVATVRQEPWVRVRCRLREYWLREEQ
jgi:hypothetical protein